MCVKEPRISHRVEQALTTYRGRGHQTIDSMKTASIQRVVIPGRCVSAGR